MRKNPLSSKVHILADTRQTKLRTNRTENQHEKTTKSDFGAKVSRMRRRYSALSRQWHPVNREARVSLDQLICTLCTRIELSEVLILSLSVINRCWPRNEICASSVFDYWRSVTRIVCGMTTTFYGDFLFYICQFEDIAIEDSLLMQIEKSALGLRNRKKGK